MAIATKRGKNNLFSQSLNKEQQKNKYRKKPSYLSKHTVYSNNPIFADSCKSNTKVTNMHGAEIKEKVVDKTVMNKSSWYSLWQGCRWWMKMVSDENA